MFMIRQGAKHYLYRHIRLDRYEPFYIGIGTVGKIFVNSEDKYYYQRAYTNIDRNNIWHKVVNKTDYKVEILLESDDYEFIKKKEIEFIALYGRKNLNRGTLTNLTDGGDGNLGFIMSQEQRAHMSSILKGKKPSPEAVKNIRIALDKRHENYVKERVGEEFKTRCGSLKIIEYINAENCTIMFNDGTIVKNVGYRDATKGAIRNLNEPTVRGIGYIGYGKYLVSNNGKVNNSYSYWRNIIKSVKEDNKNISEEWKCFQNFAQWYEENYVEGYVLNKIFFESEQIYSPNTVCFLPKTILSNIKNGGYLDDIDTFTGIYKYGNGFRVATKDNKSKCVKTMEEAIFMRKYYKKDIILSLLNAHKENIPIVIYNKITNLI